MFKTPFVIADTEFTSWEGAMARGWSGENEYKEIVQIAAIKVDPRQNFKEIEMFDVLVQPQINPELSDYFINLTHLTQEQVNQQGVLFSEALKKFQAFTKKCPVWSYGQDDDVLRENCSLYGLPMLTLQFSDVRDVVKEHGFNPSNYTSGTLHQAFDIKMTGHVHNALHDCRSIAAFLAYTQKKSK